MTGPPGVEALGESLSALAVQIADLRGQVAQVNQRLDRAGLHGDLDLVARFEELARTVADAPDAVANRVPAAPSWIGLDRQTYLAQLTGVQDWANTVLRQHYSGYELRDCWPNHIHAVWELSTLAAAWHHAYSTQRPTWPVRWSSTTAGCPAPYVASRTSPARASRTAPRAAAGDRPARPETSPLPTRA